MDGEMGELKLRERERKSERAEMVNARTQNRGIQKNRQRYIKTTRRSIYIRKKKEKYREKERQKPTIYVKLCEKQPLPHNSHSKDQSHKDKYLDDISRKILSQEMLTFSTHCFKSLTSLQKGRPNSRIKATVSKHACIHKKQLSLETHIAIYT